MTPTKYATPQAFKLALETRLRRKAQLAGIALSRVRQLLIFDRWLARMVLELGERFALKGGVALELRLTRARTTRDVDVRPSGRASGLRRELEIVAQRDVGDHLGFTVAPDRHRPAIQGDGVIYQGQRFRVQAHLAGRPIHLSGSSRSGPSRACPSWVSGGSRSRATMASRTAMST